MTSEIDCHAIVPRREGGNLIVPIGPIATEGVNEDKRRPPAAGARIIDHGHWDFLSSA